MYHKKGVILTLIDIALNLHVLLMDSWMMGIPDIRIIKEVTHSDTFHEYQIFNCILDCSLMIDDDRLKGKILKH